MKKRRNMPAQNKGTKCHIMDDGKPLAINVTAKGRMAVMRRKTMMEGVHRFE